MAHVDPRSAHHHVARAQSSLNFNDWEPADLAPDAAHQWSMLADEHIAAGERHLAEEAILLAFAAADEAYIMAASSRNE